LDEDNSIQYLHFRSKGANRTKLYINRLLPKIEHFDVDDNGINTSGDESEVTLVRTS
jgi:hypothetical protein